LCVIYKNLKNEEDMTRVGSQGHSEKKKYRDTSDSQPSFITYCRVLAYICL